MGPPLHLVDLVQMHTDFLAARDGFKGPGRVINVDRMRKIALEQRQYIDEDRIGRAHVDNRVLALDGDPDMRLGEFHVQVAALVLCIYGDGDIDVLDGLLPLVG